ncbi:MAG: DMT family transporter [Bermanella sp.]
MKQVFYQNATLLLWVSLMASSFAVSQALLPFASPLVGTALRFILGSILMLPFVFYQWASFSEESLGVKGLSVKIFIQYGFISLFLVLFFVGLFTALKTTSPLHTSIIYTLVPVVSVLFTFVGLKVVTPKHQLFGFLLGIMGAVWILLALHSTSSNLENINSGDAIFLLACCSLAMHVTLVKKWGTQVPAVLGSFYIMVCGSIILLPIILLFSSFEDTAWQDFNFWKILLYLTIFTTMATFFLQQYLVQTVGPNRLLAFTYLIPILVALPQFYLLMVEDGDLSSVLFSMPGLILTLLALYLISRQPKFAI